ncbi:MAG: hypothetical protein R3241_09915 [Rheinheimera sp.]|nr:hypothetical protein [Rheinheimera sp.]
MLLTLATTVVIAAAPGPGDTALHHSVSQFWNSLSNAPGSKPDIHQLQQLFATNAVVFGQRQKDGNTSLHLQQAADFIASQDRLKPYGFYECEIAREVRISGSFATVLSVVESRRDATKQDADFTGLNSMQWANTGDGWQLVSLYYYLPAQGETEFLLQGTPGQCLNTPAPTTN